MGEKLLTEYLKNDPENDIAIFWYKNCLPNSQNKEQKGIARVYQHVKVAKKMKDIVTTVHNQGERLQKNYFVNIHSTDELQKSTRKKGTLVSKTMLHGNELTLYQIMILMLISAGIAGSLVIIFFSILFY